MGGKLGVLIVEDDRTVAEALRDGIRLAGYEVCGIAGDAGNALDLARAARPDVAVIDVHLGEGPSGLDVAMALSAIKPLAIMFITGDPAAVEAAPIGHAWMPKPYRVLDLIHALAAVHEHAAGKPVSGRLPPDLHLIEPRRACH